MDLRPFTFAVIDEDDDAPRPTHGSLRDYVGGDAFPFRRSKVIHHALTLLPPRHGCATCQRHEQHRRWPLYVDDGLVCDGAAVAGLCAAARARPEAWTERRLWHHSDFGMSVCLVGDTYNEMHLSASGILCVEVSEKAIVYIPAAEIVARLDEWTPAWKLSRMSAIEVAEDAPEDGGV